MCPRPHEASLRIHPSFKAQSSSAKQVVTVHFTDERLAQQLSTFTQPAGGRAGFQALVLCQDLGIVSNNDDDEGQTFLSADSVPVLSQALTAW